MLDFYSIENIIKDGEEIYAWGPNLGYVVGDPFSQFGEYTAQQQAKASQEKSDNASKDSEEKSGADIFGSILDRIESIGKDDETTTVSSGDYNGSSGTSGPSGMNGTSSGDVETVDRGKTVIDFEKKDGMFFVGNNKDIKGSLDINKKKKSQGEASLNFKYDFVEKRQHNIANISFNNNVLIKEQKETLTLAVNPLDKSEAAIGVIIRDREGIDYKLELSSDLNWNGFKTLGVDLPIDINYPAIIERIYIETEDFYEKLNGNVLIDDLKLIGTD